MKKNLIVLFCAVIALIGAAFTTKGSKQKARFDPPESAYFTFIGESSGDEDDASMYRYVSAANNDCDGAGLICTIHADLAYTESETPSDWRPDFSSSNPVSAPLSFSVKREGN